MARKKAPSSFPVWARYLLVALLLISVAVWGFNNKKYFRRAYRYFTHHYIKTNFKPSDFPDGYRIHGIDVSHYQDDIDWNKLHAIDQYGDTIGFRFVFIKATEGLLIEDVLFDEYWDEAADRKLTRGAYHYFLPDRSAKLQAANFISSVKLKAGDLPPVVDVEEMRGKSKDELVKNLKEYLKQLEEHYKVKPIIYSNINFTEDFLMDDFKEYKFWIAHYYRNELATLDSIDCVFWQHTDKADLLGVRGNVDANVFNGTEYEFKKLLIR